MSFLTDRRPVREKFMTWKSNKRIAKRWDRHDVLLTALKAQETHLLQTTAADRCRGKGHFSNMMAQKQDFPAADSFLFWNADDVRAIRARHEVLSAPFQILAAPGSPETAPGRCPRLRSPSAPLCRRWVLLLLHFYFWLRQ